MSTPATPPPDYGEPWKFSRGEPSIESCYDDAVLTGIDYEMDDVKIQRAVACVNACQGMADPEAEIAHLRDYAGRTHELATQVSVVVAQREAKQEEIDELRGKVNSLEFRLSQEKHLNTDHEQDYLAVWKLIKRTDETVVQAAQRIKVENEAMREAIREAHISIKYAEASFAGMALRLHPADPSNDVILSKTGTALAKLQPFLP